ncbi:hypothetical protein Cgig2_012726 [Carnegiea gigantea]|uniref:NIF system FeS cluster assembly NifU N-terminal domain-containing protein n=1 Tax=Carnegiea gigantea TaxID=171969 RepID=A0A9Q1KC90_9CARY|nr:hypothetical protein Cgig2_012726 [Carnegiea gigantea]
MLRQGCKRLLGFTQSQSQSQLKVGSLAVTRQYHERVVDHYNNPRNVGSFDKNDPDVGTGLVGAPACGDVMKLQIKVDNKTGKIVDAVFKTFGCGSAIASSSVGAPHDMFFWGLGSVSVHPQLLQRGNSCFLCMSQLSMLLIASLAMEGRPGTY